MLYLQYGETPSNIDFVPTPVIAAIPIFFKLRDPSRFVLQFAAANHLLCKNLRNLRNGTMVATVVCRYFPSAKRRS